MYAEVIIDILNKQVNRTFDYKIPDFLEGILDVGYRVKVSFGNTTRVGFVVKIKENPDFLTSKIKEIVDIIDVKPILNGEFIDIAKKIAEENFSFYATVLEAMIPSALKIKYQKIAKVKDIELDNDLKNIFKNKKELIIDNQPIENQKIIYKAIQNNILSLDTKLKKVKDSSLVSYVHLINSDIITKSKKCSELLDYLEEIQTDVKVDDLINDFGYTKANLDLLIKFNAITIYSKEIEVIPDEIVTLNDIELTNDQQKCYQSLNLNENKYYLLHGITGSGKTELYIRWIEDVIKCNKSALLLVPEISLTPQITSIFKAKFGNLIAILHSRLTTKEKYLEWKKIINKDVKIVVGARSAIFAPLNDLGIIIIDECHESTYIQDNNPKYSSIEVAKIRSKNHHCPLVLGSATPDVKDYYYATNGDNNYVLLELKTRANGKKLPSSKIVDMREELKKGNRNVLSYTLQNEIKKRLEKNEQTILFLNRRGYSKIVMCRNCGEVVKCPHCDVSLTYHQRTNTLKCHYCGYQQLNVLSCPKCNSDKIRYVGTGTEKIEESVKSLFPSAKIIRCDRDTMTSIKDYEEIYTKFKNHEADILIGTQMIAKGLDFKDVTLVGVLNADLALKYPSYDASMVCFNLIEQVSGRAGRADKDGEVIIQTYDPNHYSITSAANHNYDEFYNNEINKRKLQNLPPFSTLIEIEVKSEDYKLAFNEAMHIKNNLQAQANTSLILGPTEAQIFKKRDIYTYLIQVQACEDSVLEKIKYLYPLYQNNKDITLEITRL